MTRTRRDPHMTQFYAALRTALKGNATTWRVFGRHIRIMQDVEGRAYQFCPLTYVAYAQTGTFFPLLDYRKAGEKLGYPFVTTMRIVDAADFTLYTQPRIRRNIQRILRATLKSRHASQQGDSL